MLASLKGKKLYSILNSKCPKCHEGDVYVSKNPYQIKDFGKALEKCPHCNFKYEKEPGFFYGAMYVSYALTVAISVAISVAIYVLIPSPPYWAYIIGIISGLVFLMPISFRLSRTIWLNLFEGYTGDQPSKKDDSDK